MTPVMSLGDWFPPGAGSTLGSNTHPGMIWGKSSLPSWSIQSVSVSVCCTTNKPQSQWPEIINMYYCSQAHGSASHSFRLSRAYSIRGQLQAGGPRHPSCLALLFGVGWLPAGVGWPWLGHWSPPYGISHPPWATPASLYRQLGRSQERSESHKASGRAGLQAGTVLVCPSG